MSSHHTTRHCFTSIDFTLAPIVIVTDFTEGQVYEYDMSLYPTQLAAWQLDPTGTFFNYHVRNIGVPFLRLN